MLALDAGRVIREDAGERRGGVAAAVVDPATRTGRPISSDWEHSARTRLLAGDGTALADVFDEYASFVFGLAQRVIGDPRAAEDVSQEVFLYLWEHPEGFDPDRGSLRTWLGTLSHRRAVDYVRREEARRRRTQREAGRRPTAIVDVAETATAMVTAEQVRNALDTLPAEQRQCIQLAYFGGKTYREVATLLGIPEGTAKSRLRLGLRRVAEVLEAEGLEPWA
jgi:RNA polymerase sigma-70 factor (ECF subfamily)